MAGQIREPIAKGTKIRGRSKVVKDWLPTSKFPNTVSLILARAHEYGTRSETSSARGTRPAKGSYAGVLLLHERVTFSYWSLAIGRLRQTRCRPRFTFADYITASRPPLFHLFDKLPRARYLPSAKPSMVTCMRAFDSTGAVETASQLCANNAAFVLVYPRAYTPLWNMHVCLNRMDLEW